MNDADRKAFEDWANKEFYADLEDIADTWDGNQYVDFAHHMAWCAWQKRGEWRDSQVGEPFGWVNSQGQFMTHQEKLYAPIKFVEREGFDTPVYVAPPAAQINQQLMEALQGLLDREWQDDEGDPRLDAARVKAKAALAAAKETK